MYEINHFWTGKTITKRLKKEFNVWKENIDNYDECEVECIKNASYNHNVIMICGDNPTLVLSTERYNYSTEGDLWFVSCLGTTELKYRETEYRGKYIKGLFSTENGLVFSNGPFYPADYEYLKSNICCLEELFKLYSDRNPIRGVEIWYKDFFCIVDKSSEVLVLYRRVDEKILLVIDKLGVGNYV